MGINSAKNYYNALPYVLVGESEMLPKAVPPLNDEQWAVVENEIKRKPDKKDIERFKKIKETFKNIPL